VEELSVPGEARAKPAVARPAGRLRRGRDRMGQWLRGYATLTRALHRTALSVIDHDCLNVAQSTAYSAIVALFPALIVAAAVIGLLPDTAPVRFQLAAFFERILPPGVIPLLDASFESTPNHTHSMRALVSAGVVSFLGASNVIATLMEGLRRARELPADYWGFWMRRRRAFELVPLSLLPLAVASVMVMFGHAVTSWLTPSVGPEARASIYTVTVLIRWAIALGASVGVIALIYHMGVPRVAPMERLVREGRRSRSVHRLAMRHEATAALVELAASQSWRATLPGAVMATAMWFLTTLGFGWYVTRFANYSEVYGSLGAGIALLFWLYIVSLSVLCGAEFNAQFNLLFHASGDGQENAGAANEAAKTESAEKK
jgi:membrane protein